MKHGLWNRRIPTLFALLLIIGGVWATSYLATKGIIFWGRASVSKTPYDIQITNVTDTSFSVSYKTSSPVPGSVSLVNNKTQAVVLDDRDKSSGRISSYALHHITVNQLSPSTTYAFSVISNDTFLNEGKPFEVTTGEALEGTSSAFLVKGSVVYESKESVQGAIVYVKAFNSQVLSTLVNPDGSYLVNLSRIRTSDLKAFAPLTENTILSVTIQGPQDSSSLTLLVKKARLIPPILIGKTYDFSKDDSLISQGTPSSSLAFPTVSFNEKKTPQIITPKKDEEFLSQQPLFYGTTTPNATVVIVIQSSHTIQATITADRNGSWSFKPATPLEPGAHTISVTTKDSDGITRTLTQSFRVFAKEKQVDRPSPTPTSVPTPTPTQRPTPSVALPTNVPLAPTTISAQLQSPSSRKGGIADPGASPILPLGVIAIGAIISSMGFFLFKKI